jgi:phosphatidylserine/phosphatidylglycerophosphate/cardiolipin synthase-like enzyme
LKKVRGGLFSSWRWRLVVAHDSYIATYIPGKNGVTASDVPEEVLRIDSGLVCVANGRYVDIKSNSGRLALCAYTGRQANEWKSFIDEFYNVRYSPRVEKNPNGLTAFPTRCSLENIEAYHCSREYYHSLAVQLLNATIDIFILSAELSPTMLLTRPPLPPLRLDQILKFKANQGIHIYIMINRESNPATASHNSTMNSYQVKSFLQNLSSQIKVIRITKNPNVGYQNEKLVVIDRVVAFTGSFDINFGQFDDYSKLVEDESGIKFPGHDYLQPCSGIMKPVRTIPRPVHKKSSPSKDHQQSSSIVEVESFGQEQAQYPPNPTRFDTDPILSDIIEGEDTGNLNNPDAPPTRFSMYQSTPFPFLQQSVDDGADSPMEMNGSSTASFPTSNTDMSNQSVSSQHNVTDEASINNRMATMFADEDVDEDEEEVGTRHFRSSTATNSYSQAKKASLTDSLFNVLSTIGSGIEEVVTSLFQEEPFIDTREEHPRQPWHGVHICVKGLSARDLSSHFVQKWRKNKTSSAQLNALVTRDITDDLYSSVCARCRYSNIFEDVCVCPNCGLPLGEASRYSEACRTSTVVRSQCMPLAPEEYSFIVFECLFTSKLGCLLHGRGPVAVEQLVNCPIDMSAGTLLVEQGPYAESLRERGLFPSVADVIVSVDYTDVSHLNLMELKRFYQRRLAARRADSTPLTVTFRRHHVQSAVNTYRTFLDRLSVVQTSAEPISSAAETAHVVSFDPVYVASAVGVTQVAGTALPSLNVVEHELSHGLSQRPHGVGPVTGMYTNSAQSEVAQRVEQVTGGFCEVDRSLPLPQVIGQAPVRPQLDPVSGMTTHGAHTSTSQMHVSESIQDSPEPDDVPLPIPPEHSPVTSPPQSNHDTYSNFYPSLDNISSINNHSPQLQQPQPYTQNWSTQHVPEEETVLEEEKQQDMTLEEYLIRHDIQRTDPPQENTVGNEHAHDGATTHLASSTLPSELVTCDESNFNDVTETGVLDRLPDAPTSFPSELFPQAPTHAVQDISSAALRGVVEDSDPHGSQNGSKRKKEVAMSGRGTQSSYPSHHRQESPVFNSSNNFRQNDEYGSYDNHISNQYPLPTATSVNEEKDWNPDDPLKIRNFAFPPLCIPDEVFLPRNRQHACNEAIQIDNNMAMSIISHSIKREEPDSRDVYPFDLHHPAGAKSSGPLCQLQVLREVAGWAVGTRTEKAIEDSWIKIIKTAEHLIYIENSLFMSMPKSNSRSRSKSSASTVTTTLNEIADALLTRLVAAATNREQFRVIIILPQHASGNFCDSYRYPMLEKKMELQHDCIQTLLGMFQKQCPNVVISEYIGFFSLRNWGIMNEKVVHSQVYVKSSILIVDDRVVVIGGADISDQGMIGVHDSNIAMLIEDTTPASIQLGARSYEASKFAHTLRMNLMRHHIGDHDPFSTELDDVANHQSISISPTVTRQNSYDSLWLNVAKRNAELYSALDGEYSFYNLNSLDAFKKKHMEENYVHKSEHDPQVQEILGGIRGFLVPFPLNFNIL